MSNLKVEVINKGEDPTGHDTAIGVIAIGGKEIGPGLPMRHAHTVRAWLNRAIEYLPEALQPAADESEEQPRPDTFYLDISAPDGDSFRLETPSPILGVNDDAEMFVLYGGDHSDMTPNWQRMYNPLGPPDRGQRLLMANHAMGLWNVFNRRSLTGTVPKKPG